MGAVVTAHTTLPSPLLLELAMAGWQMGLRLLRLPFDSAREQYALGVQAGLIERSMLASRNFEHGLGVAEQAALGPLARRV
jgi:hypothetical protein